MPPKKDKKDKSGGKKSGKEKASAILDGLPVATMTREQLEGHVIRLRDELDKEREERNYFQLERDKVQTFWEITRSQLEEKNAEIRNRDRELEETEERHLAEIKVHKQRVKHVLHEQQAKLSTAKIESLVALKEAQDEHCKNETNLLEEKRDIKKQLRDQEKSHNDIVQALRLKNSEEMANMRLEFQMQAADIESKYEGKTKTIRSQLEQRRKSELQELEERKNQQINTLIRNHDKAFVDMKNYYNDITVNNLALITTLKEHIEVMKTKEDRLEKQLNEVSAENKKTSAALQKSQLELTEMQKQMSKFERNKAILANTKIRLKSTYEEVKELKWERDVLEQKFKMLQSERDDLHGKFESVIQEVQQKTSLKNILLEQKLQTLEDLVDRKDEKLADVIASCDLDSDAINVVNRKLEAIISTKDSAIRNLQSEVFRLQKAYNELTSVGDEKAHALVIPTDKSGKQKCNILKLPHLSI